MDLVKIDGSRLIFLLAILNRLLFEVSNLNDARLTLMLLLLKLRFGNQFNGFDGFLGASSRWLLLLWVWTVVIGHVLGNRVLGIKIIELMTIFGCVRNNSLIQFSFIKVLFNGWSLTFQLYLLTHTLTSTESGGRRLRLDKGRWSVFWSTTQAIIAGRVGLLGKLLSFVCSHWNVLCLL